MLELMPPSRLCERKFIFDANRSDFTCVPVPYGVVRNLWSRVISDVNGARVLRATRHVLSREQLEQSVLDLFIATHRRVQTLPGVSSAFAEGE